MKFKPVEKDYQENINELETRETKEEENTQEQSHQEQIELIEIVKDNIALNQSEQVSAQEMVGKEEIKISCPVQTPKIPQHYILLDFSRGVAATIVLFWHYHFFYYGKPDQEAQWSKKSDQPLYYFFIPFYEGGFLAVEYFWTLSGFVFAAVYHKKATTAYQFFVQRFTRLYPLHFLTLLFAAILQFVSSKTLGYFQILEFNDVRHFILHLFMASNWGFHKGNSFNAPIWSVSVEILIYLLFFLLLPILFKWGMTVPLIVAALGISHLFFGPLNSFGLCIGYFFLGVACNIFHRKYPTKIIYPICLSLVTLIPIFLFDFGEDKGKTILIFPAVILIVAQMDVKCTPRLSKRTLKVFKWLGDNSFSMYLIHFPVIFLANTIMDNIGVPRTDVANNWWFLLSFVALVFVLGRISFVYFEMPAQNYLRKVMKREEKRKPTQ